MNFYERIEENFRNTLNRKDSEDKLFTKASDEGLDMLKNLIGDEAVEFIEFYKNLQPYDLPMLDCCASLCDIEHIIEENTELAPGAYLSKLGIYVFGGMVGGDVVCIDVNDMQKGDPCVLIIDHTFLYFDEDTDEVEIAYVSPRAEDKVDENDPHCYDFTYENVRKYVYKLEDRFTDFIEKYSKNEYDDFEELL